MLLGLGLGTLKNQREGRRKMEKLRGQDVGREPIMS
jgi:hypothetical protein